MKAWVRNCSARARSCQETALTGAFMLTSKRRRGAGADDLTCLTPDVAEAVWELTGKIISLAGSEQACCTTDRKLYLAADDDARLLASVRQHLLAGCGAGCIALVQERQLPAAALRRHQAQRHLRITQLDQLVRAKESLRRGTQVERKELRERHRHAVEHLFQGAHRGAHPVLLDERDQPVGDPGAPRQLALREPEIGSHAAQAG